MVYLVGIYHHYQCTSKLFNSEYPGRPCALYIYLNALLQWKDNINTIVEEWHPTFTDEFCLHEKETICQKIAIDNDLYYLACDCNSDDRKELGLTDEHALQKQYSAFSTPYPPEMQHELDRNNDAREQIWFDRMKPYLDEGSDIIFTLGNKHTESFSQLLTRKGIENQIMIKFGI